MKQNTILAAIFFFLLAIGLSATCNGQVVKIDSVKWVGKTKAHITATGMNGETYYLHYGCSKRKKRYIVSGSKLLVVKAPGRKREGYSKSKISIYNQ